jgi:hypothetical protein
MFFEAQEDVNIMKNMGFDAYRFSISWSRIFPSRCAPFCDFSWVRGVSDVEFCTYKIKYIQMELAR